MKLFKKEPKQITSFKESGIHMQDFEIRKRSLKENFFKCLWNSVLIFTFLYGHIGFFVSAFNLPCHKWFLLLSSAAISSYLSFLYMTALTYNIGYLLLPFVVAAAAFRLYMVVNSGFSAIMNIIILRIDEVMNLPNRREFNELFSNRTVSITATLSVISILLGIFINMWVSRRRSVLFPIVFTLIFCEISIYLNDDFSYFYFAMIVVSIILFMLTKMNDNGEFIYKKKYRPLKISRQVINLNKSGVSRRINIIISLGLIFVTFLISFILTSQISSYYFDKKSTLKEKADVVVGNLAAYGFNYYFGGKGDGGIDNGKIGDAAAVIQDGETDLVVDFVPYTYEQVYIPQFTADSYDSKFRRWTEDDEYASYGLTKQVLLDEYNSEAQSDSKIKQPVMSMRIKNEGLENTTLQTYYNLGVQYYSNNWSADLYDEEEDSKAKLSQGDYAVFYGMLPLITREDKLADLAEKKSYTTDNFMDNTNIYKKYTNLDGAPANDVVRVCRNAKLKQTEIKSLIYKYSKDNTVENREMIIDAFDNNGTLVKDELKVINKVKDFLRENYVYTLAPGAVPDYYDPISYFLLENKKGYCVYFASSAVLILRTLGVPARYVEGYAFDISALDDATRVATIMGEDEQFISEEPENKKAGDNRQELVNKMLSEKDLNIDNNKDKFKDIIYEGSNMLNFDSESIVEIDLTDMNAHAWVEVYIYGVGWVPFEFTVADETENVDTNSLLNKILDSGVGFFSNSDDESDDDAATSQITQAAIEKGFKRSVVLVILIAVLIILARVIYQKYKLFFTDSNTRFSNQYRNICKMIKEIFINTNKNDFEKTDEIKKLIISQKELSKILINAFEIDPELVGAYLSDYVKMNYTEEHDITKEKDLSDNYVKISKLLKYNLPWYRRFLY